MNDDLISRQAALDALNRIEISRNASWYEFYQKALTVVGTLPSAQPTDAEIQRMQDIEQAALEKAYECGKQDAQRWISCEERLPGEDDSFYVLCCDTHGEVMIGHVFVCKDGEETPYAAESETEYMHDCLAWMPIPEPYKEHDDD